MSFAISLAWTHTVAVVGVLLAANPGVGAGGGGLVALSTARWHRLADRCRIDRRLGRMALIVVTCMLGTGDAYPGAAALLPVLGTALVIGVGGAASDKASACAVPVADADDRARLLLLVPVALAGAAAGAAAGRASARGRG